MSHMQYETRYTLAPGGIDARAMNARIAALDEDLDPHRRSAAADPLEGLAAQGRTVGRVGIVGASGFGIGLALRVLDAGIPVTLFELERASLAKGIELARASANGRDGRMALLAATVNFHHLKDCDLIVDAAPSDMAGKQKLFRRLDQVAKPGAVLATQASHAGVGRIARYTRRAGEVLGLHMGSVSMTGETWQIVPGKDTSRTSLGTLVALIWRLGQEAEVCDPCHAFIDVKAPAQRADVPASWNIDQALD